MFSSKEQTAKSKIINLFPGVTSRVFRLGAVGERTNLNGKRNLKTNERVQTRSISEKFVS